jgi:collagenase-like PrtC family protease
VFSLPGAFYHFDIYKEILDKISPSVFYDSTDMCLWNGGRANVNQKFNIDIFNEYYKHGQKIALTFSNSVIDLSDKTGNRLLELLSVNQNYVIYRNTELAKHIKNNYDLKLVYSITGTVENYSKDWYEDILSIADYIVPRFHHLSNIMNDFSDLSKFIPMVNHSCPSNCPYWSEHYSDVDKSIQKNESYSSFDNKVIECKLKKDLSDNIYNISNTVQKINKLVSAGFKNFKLAGREFSKEQLKKELSNCSAYLTGDKNEILFT